MRESLFRWILRNHPEGEMLTKIQMFVWGVLFPIKWAVQKNTPYDPMHDTWTIYKKKFSGRALFDLANGGDQTVKVSMINGCIVLEKIDT